ncbi:unnamed protein product [Cylicocyclus nassatus]|uniref:G-protein coupled receptors family 1 profile domain-containing protein n=1 Tax=Cylicocyclus nassatus TaxID=53992 RepID=A0AA36H4R5_CYLNA|nr:unnamed protein product [Cylicocyclus nassatus]
MDISIDKRKEIVIYESFIPVIIGISLTDTVFGLAFVMSATSRLDIVANSINTGIPLIPRWVCARRIYVNLITMAYQLQGTLSLAVAIDRLLAVSIPFRYLKFGRKYNITLATGPYLLVAAGTITNFCTTYRDETLVSSFCLTLNALTPQFYGYMLLLRIGCIASSALIYVVIVTRVNKQFTQMEKSQVRIVGQSHQFHNIRRTTSTVGLSTALAVIFLLIPDLIKYFDIFGLQTNYITLLYSLSMANVDFNILIVAFRHKEIIASLKRIIYLILRRDIVKLPPKVFAATTINKKIHSNVYTSSVHFSK